MLRARECVKDHAKYSLVLDVSSLTGGRVRKGQSVLVLSEPFMTVWNTSEEDHQLNIIKELEVLQYIEMPWNIESYYGTTSLTMVEVERDNDYVMFSLFGFGVHQSRIVRSFARDNFKFYRLVRSKEFGLTHVPYWTLKIETQELAFRKLSGTLVNKGELYDND